MESQAPAVLKMRLDASDRKLSREPSFPVSRPESVAGLELWSTFIEEESAGGRLRRRLSVLYKGSDGEGPGSGDVVNLYLEKGRPGSVFPGGPVRRRVRRAGGRTGW